ncbi:MAG: bacterial transcriptional activator domain-containing protein [Gemmatimonadota bacterium]
MTVEARGVRLEPEDFPGQQGRTAFACLVSERDGPVSRSALADVLWDGSPPGSWDQALSSLASKLRSLLGRIELDGSEVLRGSAGCYELHLPPGSWVDHEAALDAIHQAEAAFRVGDPRAAYGPSAVAHHIARRPFLPGEKGRWIEERRDRLRGILARALECRAEVYLWNKEYTLALEAARDLVTLEPFRESGYRLLMRAHAAAGNGAEALRVYERCRELISHELGVGPSPETRALHAEVLRSL